MGLRMSRAAHAWDDLGRHSPQHARRREPHQTARSTGWHAVDVDAADGPLAGPSGRFRPSSRAARWPRSSSCPTSAMCGRSGDARHFRDDGGVASAPARANRSHCVREEPARKASGEQLRRLTAAHQRAGQDQIDLDTEGGHAGDGLAELLRTVRRQRPHPIVRPVRAALSKRGRWRPGTARDRGQRSCVAGSDPGLADPRREARW